MMYSIKLHPQFPVVQMARLNRLLIIVHLTETPTWELLDSKRRSVHAHDEYSHMINPKHLIC